MIIPGPNNPKSKIDIFLQPLIDELQILWNEGVHTYDISRKQNFQMRAALMWTIGDFPAYGMLSGWSTAGKLACPYCMELSKAFTLKNGGKNTWFDCHRMFLPANHVFRRNRDAFYKNRLEKSSPPPRLNGLQLWQRVCSFPSIIEEPILLSDSKLPNYGVSHNWTKRSIFWDLPYWRMNLIRHNLDVMHIEKNVFDNIFNTVMNVKGKTKDNLKARKDLREYCKRRDLELQEYPNGKIVKPKAKYTLTLEQRRIICEWIQFLRMPDGYASNLSRCVDMRNGRLFGMKSHDCHVFMECLLPTALIALPEAIWNPLTELSLFFKELCSTHLREDSLTQSELNIPVILCKLERIFPPGFFDSMEHLPIHLPYEARVGGPVQYRWMYPFERFLNKIKRTVKNKARIEGSICEAYLAQETSQFCSYYFEPHVQCSQTRFSRNDEGDEDENMQSSLDIFKLPGRASGKCVSRYLNDSELDTATLFVLLNCEEVEPFIEKFKNTLLTHDSEVIDKKIEIEFVTWFRLHVHDPCNMVQNRDLHSLAWGPKREVKTWPIYFVNGFRFHTSLWSEGKKTDNSGVCVKGNTHTGSDGDYYGILEEVIQLEYPGDHVNALVLFKCHWFDPVLDRGVRVHKHYGITEIRHSRRYAKFDPFIFTDQATQVYYTKYPGKIRDKVDWSVVIKTKPQGRVDDKYNLKDAHQEVEMSEAIQPITDIELVTSLLDLDGIVEEFDQIAENDPEDEDDEYDETTADSVSSSSGSESEND